MKKLPKSPKTKPLKTTKTLDPPIGTRIKILRLYFNLSQSELASRINLSRNRLSSIESNAFVPTRQVIDRISKAMVVSPVVILHPYFGLDETTALKVNKCVDE